MFWRWCRHEYCTSNEKFGRVLPADQESVCGTLPDVLPPPCFVFDPLARAGYYYVMLERFDLWPSFLRRGLADWLVACALQRCRSAMIVPPCPLETVSVGSVSRCCDDKPNSEVVSKG